MNHVAKNYTIGDLFLAEPYLHFVHRLPLLTFGDIMGAVELDLIYNSKNALNNDFGIANGFKLNLQKRLMITAEDGLYSISMHIEDEQGQKHGCENIDFQNQYFVVQDYSGRIIRKMQINNVFKYVLE